MLLPNNFSVLLGARVCFPFLHTCDASSAGAFTINNKKCSILQFCLILCFIATAIALIILYHAKILVLTGTLHLQGACT
jgi:hypothetical protein